MTLTSADRIVSATASTCLRLIAIAERQKGSTPMHLLSEEEKSKRYPVYEQLGAPKALVLGKALSIEICLESDWDGKVALLIRSVSANSCG